MGAHFAGLTLWSRCRWTSPAEFARITADRTYTHDWFNRFVFAPMDRQEQISYQIQHQQRSGGDYHDAPKQLTFPPAGAKRRIFFAFGRAVPNLVDRLLEVEGGARNTVIVSE